MAFSLFYAILVPSQNQREAFSTWNAFCCTPAAPLVPSAASTSAKRGHRAGGVLVQPQHPPLEGVSGPAGLPAGVCPHHRYGGPGTGGLRSEGLCPPCGGRHRPPLRLLLRTPAGGHGEVCGRARLCRLHLHPAGQHLSESRGHRRRSGDVCPAVRGGISLPGLPVKLPGRNQRARELGFYMQKYCGCVFSEADRYQKQIDRDRAKFDAEEAARQADELPFDAQKRPARQLPRRSFLPFETQRFRICEYRPATR